MKKGFTLVEVMIVVAIIAALAAIAIPNLMRARIQANETAAQAALKTILTAQVMYIGGNPGFAASLTALRNGIPQYIDSKLGSGSRNGYSFYLFGNNSSWYASAWPSIRNVTGVRYFCVKEGGALRWRATNISTYAICNTCQPVK